MTQYPSLYICVFLAFVCFIAAEPAMAAKTWKLVSPAPGGGSGGGGGSDASGFPPATSLESSCSSLAIGGTCEDSEGMEVFYVGNLDGTRLYAMMRDVSDGAYYKIENTAGGGPTKYNGLINTNVMTLPTTMMYYPAAIACKAVGASYYLPAEDELNLIWTNRAAINLTAKGFELVTSAYYWSSTEATATTARYQRFDNGNWYNGNKSVAHYRIRCFRR